MKPGRRVLWLAALAAAFWGIFAWGVAPWLIAQGYAGTSVGPINNIFGGRDIRTLDAYMGVWSRARWIPLLAIAALVATLEGLGALGRAAPGLQKWLERGEQTLGLGQVLVLGILAGTLGGGLEALWRLGNEIVNPAPGRNFSTEMLWKSPLSGALACFTFALVIAVVVRRLGARQLSLFLCVAVFAGLGVLGVLAAPGSPIHPVAELMLATGMAVACARFAVARAPRFRAALSRIPVPLASILAGLLVAGWATHPAQLDRWAGRGSTTAPEDAPNILVLILDTVRARSMSLYGYARPTTPRIDAWAEGALVFDWATSTSSWTLPSHASAFTGVRARATGTGVYSALDREFVTLAEVLRDAGYRTGGIAANPAYTTRRSGLHQGFDYYKDQGVDFFWSTYLSRWLLARPLRKLPVSIISGETRLNTAMDVRELLGEWLARTSDDRPFFTFLNIYDAHAPYTAPPPWPTLFGPVPDETWGEFLNEVIPRGPSGQEIGRWVNRYDAAIAYVDSEVDRILGLVEEHSGGRPTMVVLTSDHGELWGEKGQFTHGVSLHLPSVHVPLAISYPGRIPSGRVPDPVSIRDIPRTILGVVGIGTPPEIEGGTLAASWGEGAEPLSVPVLELDEVVSEHGWDRPDLVPMTSLFLDSLQYVVNADGSEELYHFRRDPDGRVDLAGDPAFQEELSRARDHLARLDANPTGPQE